MHRPKSPGKPTPSSPAWRPPSQVVGWKVACSCEPFKKHVIMDQLWTRVWDPTEEDFAAGRTYAGDPSSDDPEYVSDREDLEPRPGTLAPVRRPRRVTR